MKRTREALDRVRRMIDVGLVTREKSCERKERFSSLNDARHAVKHVEHRTGRDAVTYKCAFCAGWHVSKLKHGEDAAA